MKMDELRRLIPMIESPSTKEEQQKLVEYLLTMGIDLSKSYQELEMSSPYVDTHRDTTFSNTAVQLHSHNFYEILCCTNTSGAEYLAGTKRYRLQKGDIVIVAPGISHRPILPEYMAEPYCRDVLWLSPAFMEMFVHFSPEFRQSMRHSTELFRTAGTQWDFLPGLFRKGVLEYEAQLPGWHAAVMGNAMSILSHLGRALQDRSTIPMKAEQPGLLDQVMGYVEQHYSQPLSLSFIAGKFYVSSSTISHLFQERMGVSFHRYLTQRRLIAAKERIARGDLLEIVCQEVGFMDYSAFYRAFKREYGISPRQYRQL